MLCSRLLKPGINGLSHRSRKRATRTRWPPCTPNHSFSAVSTVPFQKREPPLTPTSRYQLQVEPNLDRIALAVHDSGLSPAQNGALQELVGRYRYVDAVPMVIEAPAGNDPVALKTAYDIQSALAAYGVSPERITVVSYAAPDPRAPVVVGYQTIRAAVPRCGANWGNLSRTAGRWRQ